MFWTRKRILGLLVALMQLPMSAFIVVIYRANAGLVIPLVMFSEFVIYAGLLFLLTYDLREKARRALQGMQPGDWHPMKKSAHPSYATHYTYTHKALSFEGFSVRVTECAYREALTLDRPISQKILYEHWLLTMVEPIDPPEWAKLPWQRVAPRGRIRQQIIEAMWPEPSGWAPSHASFQVVRDGFLERARLLGEGEHAEELAWAQALPLLAAVAAMSLEEGELIDWLCAEHRADGRPRAREHRIVLATVAFQYFSGDARLAPYAQWAMAQEKTALSAYAILEYGTTEQRWAAAQLDLEDRALKVQLTRRAVQELRAAGQIQVLCERSAQLKPRTDLSEAWLNVCLTSPQPAHIPLLWALFEALSLDEEAGAQLLEALEALGEAAWMDPRSLMSANAALRRRSQQAILAARGPEALCTMIFEILSARLRLTDIDAEAQVFELVDLVGRHASTAQWVPAQRAFEILSLERVVWISPEDLQLRIEAALLRIRGRTDALEGGLSPVADGAEGALSVAASGGELSESMP